MVLALLLPLSAAEDFQALMEAVEAPLTGQVVPLVPVPVGTNQSVLSAQELMRAMALALGAMVNTSLVSVMHDSKKSSTAKLMIRSSNIQESTLKSMRISL